MGLAFRAFFVAYVSRASPTWKSMSKTMKGSWQGRKKMKKKKRKEKKRREKRSKRVSVHL